MCQSVEQCYLTVVVLLQTGYQGQLVVRIVARGCSHILCTGIVTGGFIEAACVEATIAQTVIGVGQGCRVLSFLQLGIAIEIAFGTRVVLAMESDVS